LRASFVIFCCAVTLEPCFGQAAEQILEDRRAELNNLLADEWEYSLRTQPEFATQVGDDRYNDRLSDISDKAIAEKLKHARQSLERFEAIDVAGFPEPEKLNRSLMLRSLREAIERAQFKDWEMPATQFDGIHLGYASLPKGGRSTLSGWEKRWAFIRIRTATTAACRMKCGAPCAG